jgi:hypothetical protein
LPAGERRRAGSLKARSGTEPAAPIESSAPQSLNAAKSVAAAITSAVHPIFLVRHTANDLSYGRLAVEEMGNRRATELSCERLHFAAGRGSCLQAQRGAITSYTLILFDEAFSVSAVVRLSGIPSRTRVSPDGRYAATTVFVSGHSYADANFSTVSQIVDAVTGAPIIANLELMELWSEGRRVAAADLNYWGVSFSADSNSFYATVGTGKEVYLVQGDIRANRMSVVTKDIECPSLSPDFTRLAFKSRVAGGGLARWRIAILDLATLARQQVAESRFIDEQIEWLDSDRVLYTLADPEASSRAVTDVWAVPADGSGQPTRLLRAAGAPAILRR